MTFFVHVEEDSMESALQALIPRLLNTHDHKIINHGSKDKLLKTLPARLKGYAAWNAPDLRILILVDRDNDDCRVLKKQLEDMAGAVGLPTKTFPAQDGTFKVVNRIVVEELEAWFFGDVPALAKVYPGIPLSLEKKAGYRDPDAIKGGTWEKLLKVLQEAGHYAPAERLPKGEVARKMAPHLDLAANRSASFQHFHSGLLALVAKQ